MVSILEGKCYWPNMHGGPPCNDYLFMLGILIPQIHSENKYDVPSVNYSDQAYVPGWRHTARTQHTCLKINRSSLWHSKYWKILIFIFGGDFSKEWKSVVKPKCVTANWLQSIKLLLLLSLLFMFDRHIQSQETYTVHRSQGIPPMLQVL